MNKQELKNYVRNTSIDIESIVQAYCTERDLSVLDRRTRYSVNGDMTMTITIAPKKMKATCTLEDLKNGFAPVGTRVKAWWTDEAKWYTGTISKRASRGKYNVTFDDGERWRVICKNLELA